jgi:nicotinate-nucleotide pyrophosphorylase (carboxylating)
MTETFALNDAEIDRLVEIALAEDIGHGDLTSRNVIPPEAEAEFTVTARHPLTVAGIDIVARVFRAIEPDCRIEIEAIDGTRVEAGAVLARVTGRALGLLTAERTALNFIQFMSGIATHAAAFVAAVEGTGAVIVDTRKTIPGLRTLSKYAAWVGGIRNHRMRLDDGVLIKDNHIGVAGGVRPAIERVKRTTPLLTKIEVECDSLEQVAEAIDAGADLIMLDNMPPETMAEAVRLADGRVPLEASGGVTLETVRTIAETGVDFISSGRITQGAPPADIGFDVRIDA